MIKRVRQGKENIAFIFIITHMGFSCLLHRNKAERHFNFLNYLCRFCKYQGHKYIQTSLKVPFQVPLPSS